MNPELKKLLEILDGEDAEGANLGVEIYNNLTREEKNEILEFFGSEISHFKYWWKGYIGSAFYRLVDKNINYIGSLKIE